MSNMSKNDIVKTQSNFAYRCCVCSRYTSINETIVIIKLSEDEFDRVIYHEECYNKINKPSVLSTPSKPKQPKGGKVGIKLKARAK